MNRDCTCSARKEPMTRLRWTTYDDRGPSWGTARVRVVALSVVLAMTALGALTAASTTGRADDGIPAVYRRPDAARAAAQGRGKGPDRRLPAHGRADRGWRATGRLPPSALCSLTGWRLSMPPLRLATTARTGDLAAAQAAVRARRAAAETELHLRFDGDRAAVDALLPGPAASLGTAEKIPTSLLDAAKKSLEARRSLELAAQDIGAQDRERRPGRAGARGRRGAGPGVQPRSTRTCRPGSPRSTLRRTWPRAP